MTVTLITCVVAHWFANGVKVYDPLAVLLIIAGDQFPAIPLGDVPASTGTPLPEQIGAIAAKFGVVNAFTVTVKTCVGELTHWFAAAVNV